MLKRICFILALACAPAFAQTYTSTVLQNSSGNYARVVPSAPITVCASSDLASPCTTKVTTYTDQTLSVACTLSANAPGAPSSGTGCNNPGTADANGNFSVFLPAGTYRICSYAQNYQCATFTSPSTVSAGLADPGSNGVLKRTALNTTAIASSTDLIALWTGTCNITTFLRGDGNCALINLVPTGVAAGSALVSNGVSQAPVYQSKLMLDARDAGFACDNITDDTSAMNAALTTLFNQGGGTLVIPPGKQCKITGQINVPNDGSGPPAVNRPIRITSTSPAAADARGVAPTNSSGILNLTFNATNAKILTFGAGYLEIDHITLTDTASDCAAFIMTTSTTVNIHDVIFAGTVSGSACNDAVIFGGTGTTVTNTVASPFQGYGSHLHHNWFNKMRRAALLQTFANGISIDYNTIEASSGSNLANGAAIEISGDVSNADVGNKIVGNLIEMTGYVYPIKLTQRANGNVIFGNDCYDPGGGTLACIRVETGNAFNLIGTSFNGSATAVSDVDGNDTYISPISGVASLFPQGVTSKGLIRQTGPNAGTWYDILNTVDNTETFWQLNNGASTPHLDLAVKPAGGTQAFMAAFRRNGATASITDLGDSGDTDIRLRTNSSNSDLRIATTGSGQVVWLCGGAVQCKNQVNNNGQFTNSVSTGGVAPFVVTSTTPVANLSLSGVASTSQRSETGADASVVSFTPPASVGSYRLRFILSLSAANAATLGWTATWTDSNGNAQTPTNLALYQSGTAAPALTFTTSAAGNYYGEADIDVNNAAAVITVKLTFSGTSFTGKVSANIERLQ